MSQTQYASSSYNFENGTSNGTEQKPWRTLAEVNANAHEGDIVYFKRGDTFYGTLMPTAGKMQFRDYGNAALPQPIISGFTRLNPANFQNRQPNVYFTPLAQRPKVVMMNNALVEIGRTPNRTAANGGYYMYHNPVSNYIEASDISELQTDAAEVVIRTKDYSIETKPITQMDEPNLRIYYGTVPNLNGANAGFAPTHKYGYYFQNGPATLDTESEWCYGDFFGDGNCLYMYLTSPATAAPVYVSTVDILCNLRQFNEFTIMNIDFEGANRMAIDIGNDSDNGTPENITIAHCNFSYIGVRAVHARHTKLLTVEQCSFRHCVSGAVQFYTHYPGGYQPYNKILGCQFSDIAPYPGMAWNNDVSDNCAISDFVAYGSSIVSNTFDGIGKAAIHFQGDYVGIIGNKITNAMLNFADYGSIYTYTMNVEFTNRTIEDNLIHDCPGNIYGTQLPRVICNGIYLDGTSMNVAVRRNTVFNMGSSGICSNNPDGIVIENNTLYNNIHGIRYTHKMYERSGPIDIHLNENKIYSLRGQSNTPLLTLNNSFCSAISFATGNTEWSYDLQNTHCRGNVYGLTNPLAFNIEVPDGPERPSRWIGLEKWMLLADENGPLAFPTRENFMPYGQAYVIDPGATVLPLIYEKSEITSLAEWVTVDNTVIRSVENGELKIEFGSYLPSNSPGANTASFVTQLGSTLSSNKKYVFSYQIRTEPGKTGTCNSYVRTSGGSANPTLDNYRTYNDVPKMVKYLLYTTSNMVNPVFCINIEKSSGTTYITNLKVQPYDNADVDIDNAEDFVQFAWNQNWLQSYQYEPLPTFTKFIDGFGFETDVPFYLNTYQSMLLFKMELNGARPFNVLPPLMPTEKNDGIKIYPNPSSDMITIGKLSLADDWQQCDIYSAEGKIILSQKISKGSQFITIPVAPIPKGLYTAVLKNITSSKRTFRFIKN